MRHRPAALAALGIVFGIVLAHRGAVVPFSIYVFLGIAVLFALRNFGPRWLSTIILFIGFIVFGSALYQLRSVQPAANSLSTAAELSRRESEQVSRTVISPISVKGWVDRTIESPHSTAFRVHADSIRLTDAYVPLNDWLLIRWPQWITGDTILPPKIGDRVEGTGILEAYRSEHNPYQADFALLLARRTGTNAQLFLKSCSDLRVEGAKSLTVGQRLEKLADQMKHWSERQIASAIPDTTSQRFVIAVVLGDREELDPTVVQDFNASGVSHILAVSGFNIAIMSLVVFQLLRLFAIRNRLVKIWIQIFAVFLFSFITGFPPSVVRALLMIELYYLAKLVQRKPDPLNIIASAALISLMLDPADLFDAGFQLSYSAVLGIALIYPALKRIFATVQKSERQFFSIQAIEDAALLSVAATIATVPVSVLQFHRFSLAATIANIPAIPISALITVLGFLLILIAPLSHFIAAIYGEAAGLLSLLLFALTHSFASVPRIVKPVASVPFLAILSLIAALVYVLRVQTVEKFFARTLLVGVIAGSLVLTGFTMVHSLFHSHELSVLFFDIGQGDCILIHTPEDSTYFVDFGGETRSGASRAEDVAPLLAAEDVRTIQAGFISHMHLDHYGGLKYLLPQDSIARLYTSGERARDRSAFALDSLTHVLHTTLGHLNKGDILHLGPDVTLYVLHPSVKDLDAARAAFGEGLNNGSLAFKLQYHNTSVLFIGDMESSDEEKLVSRFGSFLKSDVVKVAHHGSHTSSSPSFARMCSPTFAVVSVGEHNRFGHPAPITLKHWTDVRAEVLRTDKNGAILLESDGESVKNVDWRSRESSFAF